MDLLTWILQILILTLGIYLFLRFLRTTQGNRIVRGLAFAVPLVAILVWGTAYSLQLEELRHILNGMTGFAVVFIAILFQEELRRGMAQFGENPLIRRFTTSTDTDVVRCLPTHTSNCSGRSSRRSADSVDPQLPPSIGSPRHSDCGAPTLTNAPRRVRRRR